MVNFHKVLITTAIIFTLGFALWSGIAYSQSREGWALASTVGFGEGVLPREAVRGRISISAWHGIR